MRRAAGKLLRFLVALFPVPDLLLCAKHLFVAAKDWGIDGTLLDANGQPLDLSNATLMWMVIEPQGAPALANGDATAAVVGGPTAGQRSTSACTTTRPPCAKRAVTSMPCR